MIPEWAVIVIGIIVTIWVIGFITTFVALLLPDLREGRLPGRSELFLAAFYAIPWPFTIKSLNWPMIVSKG